MGGRLPCGINRSTSMKRTADTIPPVIETLIRLSNSVLFCRNLKKLV